MTYICDFFADGLHLLYRLDNDTVHLLGKLCVFPSLQFLFSQLLLGGLLHVLDECALADLVTIVVNDVPVVVDLFADQSWEVAISDHSK